MKRIKEYSKQLFSRRAVACLFMATLLFSLGYFAGSSKTTYSNTHVALYAGFRFDTTQQRAASNALASAGLTNYRWVGDQLHVPRNVKHLFNDALAKAGVTATIATSRQNTMDAAHFFTRPFHHKKIMESRMIAATERSTADAIKWLPGIADAVVVSLTHPTWERNVWERRQTWSVSVTLDTTCNRPLPNETIVAIGQIVAPSFGITDMTEISILDARNNRRYNGSGEPIVETALLHEKQTMP